MYRFPKRARLRKRYQFQRLNHSSKRSLGEWVIVESFPNQAGITRLGITVTKRFGKAHERNRFKRLVRESFRRCQSRLPVGLDLIVKPLSQAKEASSTQIQADVLQLLGVRP
jgi:ribonuclease P protein component